MARVAHRTARAVHPTVAVPTARDRSAPAVTAPTRSFLAAAYVVLLLLGAALGVVGAFLTPAGPRVGGVLLPLGLVVAVVGNLTAGVLGLRAIGSRLGAAAPAIGWLTVVLPMGSTTSAGDLVLTGSLRSIAFLLLGSLAGAAVPTLGRPDRGVTALATRH